MRFLRPVPLSLGAGIALALASAVQGQDLLSANALADLPEARFVAPAHRPSGPPLHRIADLVSEFASGRGTLSGGAPAPALPGLPWDVTAARRDNVGVVRWDDGADEHEAMRAIALTPGGSWCSAELDAPAGSRLRFEARPTGGRTATVAIAWRTAAGDTRLAAPEATLAAGITPAAQTDLAIPEGRGAVCLGAPGGSVAFGEPRVLAPETTDDPRPRHVILLISDALRADAIDAPDAPVLARLAAQGTVFTDVLAPGAHTLASVMPILAGRDLMRLDPSQRLLHVGIHRPALSLTDLAARPNVLLPQIAEAAGYHSVFLGNSVYFSDGPLFHRTSIQGSTVTGTVDGAARLGDVFARYADERVFLVYYVTVAHPVASTPLRLAGACARLTGIPQARCRYAARVRHGDEALGALMQALDFFALTSRTLLLVTADHGESFEDGWRVSGSKGDWGRLDRGHGFSGARSALQVPLVVSGPGVRAQRIASPVMNLDILPTLATVLGQPLVERVDGELLPGFGGVPRADRRRVSYAMNLDSDERAGEQSVWWDLSLTPRRRVEGEDHDRTAVFEIWRDQLPIEAPAARLAQRFHEHAQWVADRYPGPALVLDLAGTPALALSVSVEDGRITDYGPVAAGANLGGLESVTLSPDERRLSLVARGYRGRFAISTYPRDAKVTVHAEGAGGAAPVVLVGGRQLPLEALDRWLDPRAQAAVLLATTAPAAPRLAPKTPTLRFWWEPARVPSSTPFAGVIDFDRVLRQWGYIR